MTDDSVIPFQIADGQSNDEAVNVLLVTDLEDQVGYFLNESNQTKKISETSDFIHFIFVGHLL